ncbi:tubby-related protein 2 isoform X2 [Tenrec ecaudatus]|uniref:tubby-related protein 2 isoform X2 n=1 Tax=Tenrec ecaudatus TaxID=94439 RepID=UPI003F59CBD3
MSWENHIWKKEAFGDELAIMRMQKLEQQWRIIEKKQRRKRQEHLMVQANPDAFLQHRRPRRQDKLRIPSENGPGGDPSLQENVTEAPLSSGDQSALSTSTRSCGGDSSGKENLVDLAETDSSDLPLEEDSLETLLPPPTPPPPLKEPLRTRRRGWSTCQEPEDSSPGGETPEKSEEEANLEGDNAVDDKSQDGENEDLLCSLGLPELTSDQQLEGFASYKGEDLYLYVKDVKATEPDLLGEMQEMPQVPEGEDDSGSKDANLELLPLRAPGPRLGEDLEAYMLRPAMRGHTVQCRISRNKTGVNKGMFPFYYLYLEADDGRKHFLLAGRKRRRSKTSNYLISMDPVDLSRGGHNFVGKVRSNILGTKFIIFNKGINPDRKSFVQDTAQIREELGAVCYETNILGFRGPRKMTVIIPGLDTENQRMTVQPRNVQESLPNRLQRGDREGLILLPNKAPSWSEEKGTYVLNFHGRVNRASVKNFQIVHPDDSNYLVLQFGRVATDLFTMDFSFPLCPLQAFGICLSSFDGKLACE